MAAVACTHGFLLREHAAPSGEALRAKASGSGLVLMDHAAGTLTDVELASGDAHPAIEARDHAHTRLQGVRVVHAGCSGLHAHGQAAPTIDGLHIERSGTAGPRFPGIELSGQARPTLARVNIENTGGSGIFAHGHTQGGLSYVTIRGTTATGIDALAHTELTIDQLTLEETGTGGVVVQGQATVHLAGVVARHTAQAALAAGEQATLNAEDVVVEGGLGAALVVSGSASARVDNLKARLLAEPAVRTAGRSHTALSHIDIAQCRSDGLHLDGRSRLTCAGGRIADTHGRAVRALGQSMAWLDAVVCHQIQGRTMSAGDKATVWLSGDAPDDVLEREGGRVVPFTQARPETL